MRAGDVFVHGILPRSGTNYLSRALRCHADLAASPRGLWEFPHLKKSDPLIRYARSMGRSPNLPGLEAEDLLGLVGDALLAYASEGLPAGRRLVLKEPSVRNLERFFLFFPRAYLLLLIRDGRDVACSSLATRFASPRGFDWRRARSYARVPRSPIGQLARRWSEASRTVREFLAAQGHERVRVVRFEDLVRDREGTLSGVLEFLALSPERFDWEALESLGVKGSSFVRNEGGELDWETEDPARESFAPVGRWRAWSGRESRAFLSRAAGELGHWGYLDSEDDR